MNPVTLTGKGVRTLESTESGIRIPCFSAKGLVFTAWQPTPEELRELLKGSLIWIVQRGPYIPEMTVRVGEERDVIPGNLRLNAATEEPQERAVARWKKDREIQRQDVIYGRWLLGLLAAVLVFGGWALWRSLLR